MFGLAGGPIVEVMGYGPQYGVRPIGVRHEQAATFAATAYGYVRNEVGVAVLAAGPGRHQWSHGRARRVRQLYAAGDNRRLRAADWTLLRHVPGDGQRTDVPRDHQDGGAGGQRIPHPRIHGHGVQKGEDWTAGTRLSRSPVRRAPGDGRGGLGELADWTTTPTPRRRAIRSRSPAPRTFC